MEVKLVLSINYSAFFKKLKHSYNVIKMFKPFFRASDRS